MKTIGRLFGKDEALIDGEFRGAVMGRFKNGPFELKDIRLELPGAQKRALRDHIMGAVYRVNDREHSPIRDDDGMRL